MKKKIKSASHQKKKSPILWIKFQKHKFQVSASGTILWVIWKINSLRNFSQKIFKSFENMNHMQKKNVQFVESYWKKRRFDSLSHIWKKVQFFESHLSKEGSILWVILRKRFYSLNHIQKKGQFFASDLEKSSLLWVMFKKKTHFFESYSQKKSSILWVKFIKEGSLLWVILKRRFKYLNHI